MALLSARARQAFLEFNPIAPNADDPQRIYRTIPYGPLLEVFALDLRSYRGAQQRQSPDVADAGVIAVRQRAARAR